MNIKAAETLSSLITEGGLKRIAEIGVWTGETTTYLLEHCDCIEEYYAIDPWMVHSFGGAKLMTRCSPKEWERMYKDVLLLQKRFSKLDVIRRFSLKAAKLFPPGYFDLAYLDADHFYESVSADISAWLPLTKYILAGHDYGKPTYSGVKEAVDEIFGDRAEILRGRVWVVRRKNGEDRKDIQM